MTLVVAISRGREKKERICGTEPADLLAIEPGGMIRPAGPLSYDLSVQRVSDELIVRGALKIGLECRCARCGDNFIKNILISDFCRNFALTSENDLIDLTPEVREDIFLSLPMVVVCSAGCRGLCPGCGVNLNREKCKCRQGTKTDAWKALYDFRLSFPS